MLLDLICVSGIILGMGLAKERRRYYVTPSLIGRAHTQNDPWCVASWLYQGMVDNIVNPAFAELF